MIPNIEKYRIIISRIAVGIIVLFLFTTQNLWLIKNEIITWFLFLTGVIFVGIASLGRMWCSLYIAGYKNDKLVTAGPYSISRNPLYFFSMIGVVGIGLATKTFTFPIIFILLFALYYPFVIKSEEERLNALFGVAFEEYKKKVPVFFPRFSIYSEPIDYMVKPAVFRVHMFSAIWFIVIVGLLEVIQGMKDIGLLVDFIPIY